MIDEDLGLPEPEGIKRIPLPQDMQALLLTGIFGLMILYTLYFAAERSRSPLYSRSC
jgi:hypothetical protein